ncbi:MAG: hypothetical protein OEZ48_06995 [Candidatus Bathyarchaeota archaeon]|nr:hypothetical protein [Candidatus Bathyarchaeota archaeon]MDH5687591.1 hypothetical protein [Candidatus Bathyarchaeota archaeon]
MRTETISNIQTLEPTVPVREKIIKSFEDKISGLQKKIKDYEDEISLE